MYNKKIEMVGKQYGTLTVISADGRSKHQHDKWMVKCSECVKEYSVLGPNLRTGNTKGCKYCYYASRALLSPTQVDLGVERYIQGHSYSSIGKELGVTHRIVRATILRKHPDIKRGKVPAGLVGLLKVVSDQSVKLYTDEPVIEIFWPKVFLLKKLSKVKKLKEVPYPGLFDSKRVSLEYSMSITFVKTYYLFITLRKYSMGYMLEYSMSKRLRRSKQADVIEEYLKTTIGRKLW